MSANIEYQLLGQIIAAQDLHTVEKLRIDETFFLSDSQTKEVFRFIREHYHNDNTHGSVPSWEIIQSRFAGFPYVHSNDTIATLCQEIRRYKVRAQLLSISDQINNTVDVDPIAAMNALREASTAMLSEHEVSTDMLLSSAAQRIYDDYQLLANSQGVTGIPFPWEILNEDTQGMHEGQFIVIYGRPKSMKTWVALYIAAVAYLKGMRVLVWSLEMSEMQILKRVACLIAQVDYDKFKKARLDPATAQKVWQILWSIRDEELIKLKNSGHQSALMATRPKGGTGVTSLQAKIKEFKPDLVIVDGMYLMRDDRQRVRNVDWKSIAHISQDLKTTAGQFDIPIIGVTQANRGADKDPKKADLSELAYADALAQDCDLCLRVTKQIDQASREFELVISIPGGRETLLDAFVIHGCAATNLGFKRAAITDPNAPQQSQQTPQKDGKKGQGTLILPNFGGK